MKQARAPGFRIPPHAIDGWLDRLDGRARPAGGDELRLWPRFTYRRKDLVLEVVEHADTARSMPVAARNLSRSGTCVISERFVYPRARCRLTLVSPRGRTQSVGGSVVRCRYLVGSGALHEVGIRFDEPVEVEVFTARAKALRIVLASATDELVPWLRHFLDHLRTTVVRVETPARARAAATETATDLVLVDLDTVSLPPAAFCREMRDGGYVGPIVGLSGASGTGASGGTGPHGLTGCLTKPLLPEELRATVDGLLDPPLPSSLAANAAIRPLIDRFVNQLHGTVARLLPAAQAPDLPKLTSLANWIRTTAASYGFEEISEEAAYVRALIACEAPLEDVRTAVRRLVQLGMRARGAGISAQPGIGENPHGFPSGA